MMAARRTGALRAAVFDPKGSPHRMPLPRCLALTALLVALPLSGRAAELKVLSWGGEFSAAQQAAFARPFTQATGIAVDIVDAESPTALIKSQVTAGNVTFDLASVGLADAVRLCDEGLALPIDHVTLAPGADGTPAAQDFLPGTLGPCFVPTDVYATVIAYDASRPGGAPQTIADFFDVTLFPGRRGLLKEPRFTLEMALMGDGVPADQVYATLSTPQGLDRAFAKLDQIRRNAVWWEAGSQPVQLLADGEVAMTMAYNGRIFAAQIDEDRPFRILWDGQVYETEGWMIPKGAPNPEEALRFVAWTTAPEPLARAAEQLSYGPPRRSSQALVGVYARDGKTPMAPHLPTTPENMKNALAIDTGFWVDHDAELTERFAAWLAGADE